MKKSLLIVSFILMSSNILAFDSEAMPIVSLGHRFGANNLNDPSATYGSLKLNLLKSDLADFRTLNMLSLGVNYQDDKKWAFSVSPLSVSSMSGLTIGLDVVFKEKNVKGGFVGFSIGYKFH
jgi:hypothetical protein